MDVLASGILSAERNRAALRFQLRDLARAIGTGRTRLTIDGPSAVTKSTSNRCGVRRWQAPAKSYVALYLGRPVWRNKALKPVLVEWELSGEDTPGISLERYSFGRRVRDARCHVRAVPIVPSFHEVDRLAAVNRARGGAHPTRYMTALAFACDGPPEAAEVPVRYFPISAARSALVHSIIAHVSKADWHRESESR
jgi:hypothetical protein